MIRQIILRGSATVLFLLFCLVSVVWLELSLFAHRSFSPHAEETVVWVKPGQGLKRISHTLYREQVIEAPWKFQLLAHWRRQAGNLKAGEYTLSGRMSPAEVLDVLVSGKVRLYRVTIPEGLNLYEIADLLDEGGFLHADAFIAAATDPEITQSFGIEAATLEGYLFPDTYMLPRSVSEQRMLRLLVNRFQTQITPEIMEQAASHGFSLHEAVILASIIEKEAVVDAERPLISSVFHNRLNRNMRLDSDPTAVYGMEGFEGRILRRHLKVDSPYNTYRIRGLPAGPIANPGLNSIKAAVNPLESDYLFFVAKGDLTHKFTTSLEEHNRAVQKYIRGGK